MRVKLLLSAGLGAVGFGLLAMSAQAAPAGGLVAAVDREVAREVPLETVTWHGRRHCYWHYGHRRCWYGHGHHYGKWHNYRYYGYARPYRHHYGYGYRRSWY